MARKTLIHKHTNLTTTSGGVLSPKLPTVGTLEKGEIAVNYKNGYETLSIENDAGEVIPFGSLELTMAYTDAAILGNKPLVIEVNHTDTTVPSGTYASITTALAVGKDVIIKVSGIPEIGATTYCRLITDYTNVDDSYIFAELTDTSTQKYMVIINSDNSISQESVYFAQEQHNHGYIDYDGTFSLQTSDTAIANNDKIVICDASDGKAIKRSSITFDGSTTTKALTQKGTWETFLQTESDPTVPNWAKLLNKPTYTLDEVNDGSTRKLSDYLALSGGTMTGALTLNGAPSSNLHAATKKYVDDSINELPSPMIFKGSLGTGGTITTLPTATTSNEGYTYKVITNGTYGGQSAKIGDTFISDGSNWIYIPSGDEPSGTVTNVKIQATSPIAIDDSSAITTSGTRTISHNDSGVTAGTYKSVTVDAKGHITGGTNPTTLAGYGITDAINTSSTALTKAGDLTAAKFIKSGGTSTQFLKADGSVDSTTYAPLNSPAITGTPTAPTAAVGTNTTLLATTAFVLSAVNGKGYWANLLTASAANYITEPEVKSVKINGSSTNAASTENAVIQYDTTNKCIKFVFN